MITLLETTQASGQEIKIWHSDNIEVRSVVPLILKGYAKLIEKKFILPNIYWPKFGDSMVVWVTDGEEKIIGGIHYGVDSTHYNAGIIQLVFVEHEKEYTEQVHGLCLAHIKKFLTQQGLTLLMQEIHMDNQPGLDLAFSAGLKPKFYYLSRSLVDDD